MSIHYALQALLLGLQLQGRGCKTKLVSALIEWVIVLKPISEYLLEDWVYP